MTLVSVDAPLALLQVDGIGGQIPVDDRVAPEMEVQSLLSNRSGREDERPEWGIERSGDGFDAGLAAVVERLVAECDGEAGAHPVLVEIDMKAVLSSVRDVHAKRGGVEFQGLREAPGEVGGCLRAPFVVPQPEVPEPVSDNVGVLVEDGLEVAVDRVSEHITPVAAAAFVGVGLLRAPAGSVGRDLGSVEEAPERATNPRGVQHGGLMGERKPGDRADRTKRALCRSADGQLGEHRREVVGRAAESLGAECEHGLRFGNMRVESPVGFVASQWLRSPWASRRAVADG